MLTTERVKSSKPPDSRGWATNRPTHAWVLHHGAFQNIYYLLGKQSTKWECYSTPLLSSPCSQDVRSHFPQDKKETHNGIHTDGERGGKSLRITPWVTDVSRTVVSELLPEAIWEEGDIFFPSQLKIYKDGHFQSTCFLLMKTDLMGTDKNPQL